MAGHVEWLAISAMLLEIHHEPMEAKFPTSAREKQNAVANQIKPIEQQAIQGVTAKLKSVG